MVKKNYSVRYVAGLPVEKINPMTELMLGDSLPVGMPLKTENNELKVVIWNIYKQQRPDWRTTLNMLTQESQLILLQEAQTSPELVEFAAQNHLVADQVPALLLSQHPSGVMTLATSHPIYCCPLREKEPFLRLSKSALITVYPLFDGQHLMVINVHAINFSFGVDVYQRQLKKLTNYICMHKGPVILGGDFNAWSRQRMNVLKRFIRTLHLKEVNFYDDKRTLAFGKPLDYVFYRGINVKQSTVLPTNSSDHNPIIITFSK